ncbi:MAG: DNA repair protein RecO [Eubacteriales bacterium]
MYTETDGLVIKKIGMANGKNMLTILTRKFGKISAASSITEKNRTKSSMAVRPFSYSRFEMYKNTNNYNIVSGELLKSYYKIGEDIDKYVQAAYVMEYTEKILAEGVPSIQIYSLILDYLEMLALRKDKYTTLTLAYQLKTLKYLGAEPLLTQCVNCGKKENFTKFSIKDGGLLCCDCVTKIEQDLSQKNKDMHMLIYPVNFDMIKVVMFILKNPLKALEGMTLKPEIEVGLTDVLKEYVRCHLNVEKLKTESFCWIN